MDNTKRPPGLMLYDKDFQALCWLSPEDFKAILVAAFDYKNTGALPELSKDLAEKWPFVQAIVENDLTRYEKSQGDRSYGGYMKEHGKTGSLSRDEYDHAKEVIHDPAGRKKYFAHVEECMQKGINYWTPEEFLIQQNLSA